METKIIRVIPCLATSHANSRLLFRIDTAGSQRTFHIYIKVVPVLNKFKYYAMKAYGGVDV
jgi:hypothetical protein